jgi:hypothetical protein
MPWAHIGNLSYLGSRDWEDPSSRPARTKHSCDPISYACHFSYAGSVKKKDHGAGWPKHKSETLFEK